MKATKHTLTVKIEVMSPCTYPDRLIELINLLRKEHCEGKISCEDGDYLEWETKQESVEF